MKFSEIVEYTKQNPTVSIAVICAVASVIIVALWLGVDMSWLPQLIRDALGL